MVNLKILQPDKEVGWLLHAVAMVVLWSCFGCRHAAPRVTPRIATCGWAANEVANRMPMGGETNRGERRFSQPAREESSERKKISFKQDLHEFPSLLKNDVLGLWNDRNLCLLAVAAGGAIAVRETWDDSVRDSTDAHPERWGKTSKKLGYFGQPEYQVPVMLGIYSWSLHQQDERMHEFSRSLISAFTLTGVGTTIVKGVTNTERPSDEWNNGHFGFPSFHTGSLFAASAVVEEHYGSAAGLSMYALSGLVGWSRIDERDHDLSDVVFGAALGWMIGKSVAGRHLRGDSRVRLLPYQDADGTGAMLEFSF